MRYDLFSLFMLSVNRPNPDGLNTFILHVGKCMKINILIVAVFTLFAASCGKSDDVPEVADTAGDAPDVQDEPVQQAAVTNEVQTAAVESAAAAAETGTQTAAGTNSAGEGEAVYKKACISCHMTGAAGAPKLGDKSAWEPRIGKGIDALVESAMNGVPGTAMVAKGACTSCSDDDIRAAIEYMVSQSR